MELRHLLVLCCYGGQPFVDFHLSSTHSSTQQLDPTDWQANDIAGSLLDNSSMESIPHLREVLNVGVSLSACDLFNVTFTTTADQDLYERYQATLACRCHIGFTGDSCEISAALPLTLSRPQSQPMVIVLAAILLAFFIVVFMDVGMSKAFFDPYIHGDATLLRRGGNALSLTSGRPDEMTTCMTMVRGCFCDCFGPSSRARAESLDKPLDPEDARKCLQKYRAYEARQEMVAREQQRPLIPTISESCAAPYDNTVLPSAPTINVCFRPPSPPPSYSSIAGRFDSTIPTQSQV